jgi:hypothetical protein
MKIEINEKSKKFKRNMEILKYCMRYGSFKRTAIKYNITPSRVGQIFRTFLLGKIVKTMSKYKRYEKFFKQFDFVNQHSLSDYIAHKKKFIEIIDLYINHAKKSKKK